MIAFGRFVSLICLAGLCPAVVRAQQYDASLFAELHWRLIGPFRGGRTVGATGVSGQPNVLYIGVNNGGVWKRDRKSTRLNSSH